MYKRNFCSGWIARVDCEPLMKICCGKISLLNDELRPIFHRMGNSIVQIFENDRAPYRNEADPIQWSRRVNNTVADRLCNYTMDIQKSWRETWTRPDGIDIEEANILAFSDGGSRKGACSASAWIMFVCGDDKYFPLAAQGMFFPEALSSFTVECIALENAIEHVKRFCCKHGKRDTLTQ